MDEKTQILSTGKKVNSAVDDPNAYFLAQNDTQQVTDLQTLKDSMGEAIETINSATNGLSSITDLVASAKSLAQSALASDDATERASYMDQYNAILTQIDDMADDSGYQSVNLLGGATQSLVVNFDATGSSKITLTGVDASSSTGLGLTQQAANSWTADAAGTTAINAAITALDAAKSEIRTDSKNLASQMSTITTRQDYTTAMISTLNEGASNLVTADTNTESAALTALQTQQSFAINSLSISSSSYSAILKLFQ